MAYYYIAIQMARVGYGMHEFVERAEYVAILRALSGGPKTFADLRSQLTTNPPKRSRWDPRPMPQGTLKLTRTQLNTRLLTCVKSGIVICKKVDGRRVYRLADDFSEINRRFVRELHLNFLREERGVPFDYGHGSIAVHGVPKDS